MHSSNKSHRYCIKVIKFHCNNFSGLRAVEEKLVEGAGGGGVWGYISVLNRVLLKIITGLLQLRKSYAFQH